MIDPKKWKIARSRLQALREHLPGYPGHGEVADYHSIVDALEVASGEDLVEFRIPIDSMKPRATSIQIGGRHSPGRTTWSKEVYADSAYFRRQVDGLSSYVQLIDVQSNSPVAPNDYWSMSTAQLEDIAAKYHIGGYGDHHSVDRQTIIDALLKRDRALNQEKSVPHSQTTIRVEGNMTGSNLQIGSPGSVAHANVSLADQITTLSALKGVLAQLDLHPDEEKILDTDIATMEIQLNSGKPRSAIMHECWSSVRGILEKAAGGLLTSGILHEISKILAN